MDMCYIYTLKRYAQGADPTVIVNPEDGTNKCKRLQALFANVHVMGP